MTGPSAPRPQGSIQQRIIALFTERFVLKITAVFLAVVLWFVVNAKEPQTVIVPVRFDPVLDSSLVLRDPPPVLEALIAGSPNELIKLSANAPVIHRQITADAPDTLVIDLRPSDVTLPEGVDAVVRDLSPRSVTLRFESTWSRRVPIRSMLSVVAQQGPITLKFDPESVQVSGPRRIILRLSSVRTVPTTISFPDSFPHLVDLDTTGLGPGVRLKPTQVRVQLESPMGGPAGGTGTPSTPAATPAAKRRR